MTMLGGTKVPSKRAVFGDISNTTRASNGIHDNAKAAGLENSKPIAQGKGATFAFEKPAQRMGLQNVIKNFVTGGSSSQASENNATNRPRALSKRATTQVYQDENSYPQAENASFQKTQNNSGPLPPVHQSLIPNKFKSQPQLRTNQPIGVPQQENYATNGYAAGSAYNSQPALAKAELPAQPKEEQQVHIHQDHASSEPAFFDALPHLERPVEKNELQVVPLEQQYYQGAEMQHRALPLVSEPEEYWVEEEEVYDEQGYTQTNSLSHGGNTTANLTTSLIPMVNKRIRIELAECKKIVEAARTPEEIEEDKYDTSMVAEYSEEIFEYMREMEVSFTCDIHLDFVLIVRRRSRCLQTQTTWTTKPRFSGPCGLSSWTGSSRFTTALLSCRRHCSSVSTTLTASCPRRLSPWASSSSSARLLSSLLPSTRRSTAHPSTR
jgi:hypothetical protein